MQDFARCIELYPENSPSIITSYFHFAKVLAALGQHNRAMENLKTALNLDAEIGVLSPVEITDARLLLEKLSEDQDNEPVTN